MPQIKIAAEPGCIAGDTEIIIQNKIFSVEEAYEIYIRYINQFFSIKCYNEKDNFTYTPIIKILNKGRQKIYVVKTDNHKISVTADHELLTKDGYKKTIELTHDDKLLTVDGYEKINHIINNNKEKIVYDIVCDEPYHNFVANGIVAHNCTAGDALKGCQMTKEEAKKLIEQMIKDKIISKEEVIEIAEGLRKYDELKETEKAYIAGIVDGEGHIGIGQRIRYRKIDGRKYETYTLYLTITNTYHELIYWLKKKTNMGNIANHHDGTIYHKKALVWQLRNYEIKNVIEAILPFLIIKKEQAELMLEYILAIRKVGRYTPLTEKESFDRNVIFLQIAELNKRGGKIAAD